jgi:hypothetical protein
MYTYTIIKDGKTIATKLERKKVMEMTGINSTSLSRCINNHEPYLKIFYIHTDGEIPNYWKEDVKKKWGDIQKAVDLIKTCRGKIVTINGRKVTVMK